MAESKERTSSSWPFSILFNKDNSHEKENKALNELPESERTLTVKEADECFIENGLAHHTYQFDRMRTGGDNQLIVRRGQSFTLHLHLSRPFNPSYDSIFFTFTYANADITHHGQGTFAELPLQLKKKVSNVMWSAIVENTGCCEFLNSPNLLTVRIRSPPDCIVGKWHLEIDCNVQTPDGIRCSEYKITKDVCIIFNPWCPRDQVYISDPLERDEYVISDAGLIWCGNQKQMTSILWRYSQYERHIFDCILLLFDIFGRPKCQQFSDAIKVSKFLATVTKIYLLDATYTEEYPNFRKQGVILDCLSSLTVLQNFYKNQQRVCCNKSTVFAGIITTTCRALGIPCRPVTNYNSAFTKDGGNSVAIEYYIDENGDMINDLCSGSIWNYHVWNEIKATRLDLGPRNSYGGWQAIDALAIPHLLTTFGPSSLKSIKFNEVNIPLSTEYFLMRTNAEVIYWLVRANNQPKVLLKRRKDATGTNISTKEVGFWGRKDITLNYKCDMIERQELLVLDNMISARNPRRIVTSEEDIQNISFAIQLPDPPLVGNPFVIKFIMKNKNPNLERHVDGILKINIKSNLNHTSTPIKQKMFQVKLLPKSREMEDITLRWEGYSKYTLIKGYFTASCLIRIEEENCHQYFEEMFQFRKPEIKINLTNYQVNVGDIIQGQISFKNPLPIKLSKPMFLIEGSGIDGINKLKITHDLYRKATATATFRMYPKIPGHGSVIVRFKSKELKDIKSHAYFEIFDEGTPISEVRKSFGSAKSYLSDETRVEQEIAHEDLPHQSLSGLDIENHDSLKKSATYSASQLSLMI